MENVHPPQIYKLYMNIICVFFFENWKGTYIVFIFIEAK